MQGKNKRRTQRTTHYYQSRCVQSHQTCSEVPKFEFIQIDAFDSCELVSEDFKYIRPSDVHGQDATIELIPNGMLVPVESHSKLQGQRHIRWSQIELIVHCKSSEDDDGFTDDRIPPTWHNSRGRATRQETIQCLAAGLTQSNRTHLFMLCIYGTYARFIRADRSATIVSKRFDYVEDLWLLVLFLRTFCAATQETRGHDTSVRGISENAAEYVWGKYPEFRNKSLYRFDVPGKEGHSWIGPKSAQFLRRGLGGACTRG